MTASAVAKLVEKWRNEQADYPGIPEGLAASAAVRLCADELEAALRQEGQAEMEIAYPAHRHPAALATAPPEQAALEKQLDAVLDNLQHKLYRMCCARGDAANGTLTWKEINAAFDDVDTLGLYREYRADQPQAVSAGALTFQQRVREWTLACFGQVIADDKVERNHRFLEESLELVQALGCTQSEAHQLVDYVYGRPSGHQDQECGGALVTLAALCNANQLDMNFLGDMELARVYQKIDLIRAKQAAKPKHSPLSEPESLAAHDQKVRAEVLEEAAHIAEVTWLNRVGPTNEKIKKVFMAIRSLASGAVEKKDD